MVTHDPVVARLADRRIELHHGKIAAQEVFAMADEEQFDEVLEELYALEEHNEIAEIARMEVHGALPVSIAVEKMEAMGLVATHPHPPQPHDHKPFVNPCHDALKPSGVSIGEGSLIVELTTRGRLRAADIIRRHRLAERLFTHSLAMDSETEIEQQGCKFEHILSGEATEKILALLGLVAALLAFVVQSGELGTADTMHRLQTTHWLWTPEPQVFPNEYPEFGLHGRGGRLYSWYGIGQSLLMLPADLVATGLARLPIFEGYEDDPAVRSIVVSYLTSILVNVLTAQIAFRFLRQLCFSVKEAAWGLLALLFCTTHLHYTQNMQENNYIMLLTLLGFSLQYEWLRTGSTRALFIGSAALGLNLLTRLTTGLDLIAVGIFLLFILWFERTDIGPLWRRF